MKKLVSGIVCAAMLVSGALMGYAYSTSGEVTAQMRSDFTVIIDGETRTFYSADGNRLYPLLYNGSTYLPLRAIGEIMGKTVNWNESTKTITLSEKTGSTVTDADTFDDTTTTTGSITLDRAKEIALAHAGISSATFTKAKTDWDDGRQVYDLEFYAGGTEYEYEIAVKDGAIISSERDKDEQTNTNVAISMDTAKQMVLDKVPGASASQVRIELDLDDGRYIYEGELKYNGMEYEFEIDANTGNMIKWESERD